MRGFDFAGAVCRIFPSVLTRSSLTGLLATPHPLVLCYAIHNNDCIRRISGQLGPRCLGFCSPGADKLCVGDI